MSGEPAGVGAKPAAAGPAAAAAAGRPGKSSTAFKTISEVAEELGLAQHVLRFWESKFPQLRPLKRGGGRRYYRPEDLGLLREIRNLLYNEGYTIRGAQRFLRAKRAKAAQAPAIAAVPSEASAATPAGPVAPGRAAEAASPRPAPAAPRPGRELTLRQLRDELQLLRDLLAAATLPGRNR